MYFKVRVRMFFCSLKNPFTCFRVFQLGHLHVSVCLTKVGKIYLYLAAMVTYYFKDPEEALKKAKAAGKKPGCWYGGVTLRSGKKGWAIYRGGKVVEMYAMM